MDDHSSSTLKKKKAAADLNLVASLGKTPTHLNLHHISQYRSFFLVHGTCKGHFSTLCLQLCTHDFAVRFVVGNVGLGEPAPTSVP